MLICATKGSLWLYIRRLNDREIVDRDRVVSAMKDTEDNN